MKIVLNFSLMIETISGYFLPQLLTHRWNQEKGVHASTQKVSMPLLNVWSGKYSNPPAHDNDRRYAVCQFVTQIQIAFTFDQN